jgi:NADPH:quinone reductase-like Zn-dependent oxidoreductase
MIALKPRRLSLLDAASAPVIAVTAYQMLFEHANAKKGDSILITGAAGNVGAYAAQMALSAGIDVVAVARANDRSMLRNLGVEAVADSSGRDFERGLPKVDAILDLVGAETLERCLGALKPGGKLVTVVTQHPAPKRTDVETIFFYAEVTTARLRVLTEMFESGRITARVGSVLPLEQARRAHEMLAGAPHDRGKIMLEIGDTKSGRRSRYRRSGTTSLATSPKPRRKRSSSRGTASRQDGVQRMDALERAASHELETAVR